MTSLANLSLSKKFTWRAALDRFRCSHSCLRSFCNRLHDILEHVVCGRDLDGEAVSALPEQLPVHMRGVCPQDEPCPHIFKVQARQLQTSLLLDACGDQPGMYKPMTSNLKDSYCEPQVSICHFTKELQHVRPPGGPPNLSRIRSPPQELQALLPPAQPRWLFQPFRPIVESNMDA